jgi:hypothetical protein
MSDPVASTTDLDTYLGLDGDIDEAKATLLLQLAHDKCEAIVSPVPDAARGVELDVAARAYMNPTNVVTNDAGPYGSSTVMGGLWLTKANIADLRRMAPTDSGSSGAFTIDPTPADAGPCNTWAQYPLTLDDYWNTYPYGFDVIPT